MGKRNGSGKNYFVSTKLYQCFLREVILGTDVMVGLNLL